MIIDIFEEYIMLSGDTQKSMRFQDIYMRDEDLFAIVRLEKERILIYSLTNGVHISIPSEWYMLFSGLNTYAGERILYIDRVKKGDNISKTIYYFLKLVLSIERRDAHGFSECLNKVLEIGTEDFRKWYKEKFHRILGPIERVTINSIIDR